MSTRAAGTVAERGCTGASALPLPALPIDMVLAGLAAASGQGAEPPPSARRIGDDVLELSVWREDEQPGGCWRANVRVAGRTRRQVASDRAFLLLWEVGAYAHYLADESRVPLRTAATETPTDCSVRHQLRFDEALPGLGRVGVSVVRERDGAIVIRTSFSRHRELYMPAPTLSGALSGSAVAWQLMAGDTWRRPPPARERRASRRSALARGWLLGSVEGALADALRPWRVEPTGGANLPDASADTARPCRRAPEFLVGAHLGAPRRDGSDCFRCRVWLPELGAYELVAPDPLVVTMAACEALRLLKRSPFLPRLSRRPSEERWALECALRAAHLRRPPAEVSGHLPSGEAARIHGRQLRRGEWRYELAVGDAPPVAAHGVTALGALVNLVPAWR